MHVTSKYICTQRQHAHIYILHIKHYTYTSSLYEGCGHDYDGDLLLPDHPPEVRDCVCNGPLSCNVLFLLPTIALCFLERWQSLWVYLRTYV